MTNVIIINTKLVKFVQYLRKLKKKISICMNYTDLD